MQISMECGYESECMDTDSVCSRNWERGNISGWQVVKEAQGLDWDRSPELEPQDEDFKEENKDVLDENIIRKH